MLSRILRSAPLKQGAFRPLAARALPLSSQILVKSVPAPSSAFKFGSVRFYSEAPVLTRESVLERVSDVLANCEKIDAAKIAPNALLEQDVGLDSLDVVDFLFYIEEEFTIQMPDHIISELKTVQDVADWVFDQPDAC